MPKNYFFDNNFFSKNSKNARIQNFFEKIVFKFENQRFSKGKREAVHSIHSLAQLRPWANKMNCGLDVYLIPDSKVFRVGYFVHFQRSLKSFLSDFSNFFSMTTNSLRNFKILISFIFQYDYNGIEENVHRVVEILKNQ